MTNFEKLNQTLSVWEIKNVFDPDYGCHLCKMFDIDSVCKSNPKERCRNIIQRWMEQEIESDD